MRETITYPRWGEGGNSGSVRGTRIHGCLNHVVSCVMNKENCNCPPHRKILEPEDHLKLARFIRMLRIDFEFVASEVHLRDREGNQYFADFVLRRKVGGKILIGELKTGHRDLYQRNTLQNRITRGSHKQQVKNYIKLWNESFHSRRLGTSQQGCIFYLDSMQYKYISL